MNKLQEVLLTLLFISFILTGCNDSFVSGYSDDPNLPTDAPAEKIFIAAQSAQIIYHEGYASRLGAMWSQQVTGLEQYENRYSYGVTTQDFLNIWDVPYVRVLGNLNVVKQKARADGKQNLLAVSKISEAITMGTTTALFGNVPYSEAGQDILNPQFDEQANVYNALIDTLDQAISNIEGGLPDLPNGIDAFSPEGDIQQWLAAAYTVKARFHLHLSNTDNAQLDLAFQAAQNGIMENTGDNDLMIPHGNVSGENVNLWSAFTSDRGYVTGEDSYALALMNNRSSNSKTDETARINYYFDPSDNYLPNTDDGAFQPDSPFPLATYVENMLIIAEVEARRDNDQQALNALNNVRQYNEDTYGGTYDDLTLVDFQAGGEYEDSTILQEVLDEAYLSYMSRLEAFNLVRRVDYPLTPASSAATTIPQRFLYSESETNANPNTPDPLPGLFDATPVNQ